MYFLFPTLVSLFHKIFNAIFFFIWKFLQNCFCCSCRFSILPYFHMCTSQKYTGYKCKCVEFYSHMTIAVKSFYCCYAWSNNIKILFPFFFFVGWFFHDKKRNQGTHQNKHWKWLSCVVCSKLMHYLYCICWMKIHGFFCFFLLFIL